MDPVVLFFLLGLLAALVKSGLKIPEDFYDTVNIYLLLSIGIKGGIELYHTSLMQLWLPAVVTLLLGGGLTLLAFAILRTTRRFSLADCVSVAIHYGSVSAVTFAVVTSFLQQKNVSYEPYCTVLVVLLEIPAIAAGVALYKVIGPSDGGRTSTRELLNEVFLSKSIVLLLGGMAIGYYMDYSGNKQLNFFFYDLFKGFLALFLLEMGIVTANRLHDIRKAGVALVAFGILMPVLSAMIGLFAGKMAGLSQGGYVVLGTLCASASYIAAPAAVRIAIPEANQGLAITSALGITFPFNVLIGISLYYEMAQWLG